MNIVYTTLDNVRLNDDTKVQSYKDLDEKYQRWIEVKTTELLKNRTYPELKLSSILKESVFKVEEQAYFQFNGKGYFLDFFIPELNIAIELNGSIHRSYEAHDKDLVRDSSFLKIGITTIRLTNRQVYEPDIKFRLETTVQSIKDGTYDNYGYYDTPNCVKFDGKPTPFQQFFTKLNQELLKYEDNESVLLKTTETYLLTSLYDLDNISNNAVNKEYIEDIADTVKSKNLNFHVCFTGRINKICGWKLSLIIKCDDEAKNMKFDRIINGSEIQDCKIYRKAKNRGRKTTKIRPEDITPALMPF